MRNVDDPVGKDWSLKISLTSFCNMRCIYCKDSKINPKSEPQLSKDEYIDILKAARENGLYKVQWTGGECSITNIDMFSSLAYQLGYKEQALTSNGVSLEPFLDQLIASGLTRANISLDSLNPDTFEKITGRRCLDEVLKSIEKCAAHLDLTKINIALMKLNLSEVLNFVDYASTLGPNVILKFHELWRYEPIESYQTQHLTSEEILAAVSHLGLLKPLDGVKGNNPSIKYYHLLDRNVQVGVSPVPKNWTCGGSSCKKIRVYANGKTCEGRRLYGTTFSDKIKIIGEIIERRSTTVVKR